MPSQDIKDFIEAAPVFDGCSDAPASNQNYILPNDSPIILPPNFQGLDVPRREWAVKDWVPDECVTGLYGDGGVGKSLLAMMLMTCITQDFHFLGLPVKQARTFGFFCEDAPEELHRRQNDINRHYGCDFADLKGMAWQSRVGCDNTLMTFRDGKGTPTPAYARLRENVRDWNASFVVIDTAADTFGGNENARQEVRQFINLLGSLSLEIKGAVVLCAHPSASGLMTGSGTGGSTAWNNTLRSRLYLRRPKANDKEMSEEESQGIREIENKKANYGPSGNLLTVRWEKGAFSLVTESPLGMVEQLELNIKNKGDDSLFLQLLAELTKRDINVSCNPKARNFAPRHMKDLPNTKDISQQRLSSAMNRLIETGKIAMAPFGSNASRHSKTGLKICALDT